MKKENPCIFRDLLSLPDMQISAAFYAMANALFNALAVISRSWLCAKNLLKYSNDDAADGKQKVIWCPHWMFRESLTPQHPSIHSFVLNEVSQMAVGKIRHTVNFYFGNLLWLSLQVVIRLVGTGCWQCCWCYWWFGELVWTASAFVFRHFGKRHENGIFHTQTRTQILGLSPPTHWPGQVCKFSHKLWPTDRPYAWKLCTAN